MVITDERILFVSAEEMGAADAADAGSLDYGDIGGIGVENGIVSLRSADGVTWRFPLPQGNQNVVDPVVRHLRWIGDVRGRVVAARNDVDLAAGQIRECAEAMAWDDAIGTYERVRADLDDAIGAVQRTVPIDDDVLAPDLTEFERTLEGAYADALIERAESRLTLGRQLVENEDYDQARDVLADARADHAEASEHADAVQRGDAFQFGQQRELQNRLQRLDWEFDAVAAEPIRLAHEARILAENADDLDVAIDHWEAAFRRYATVIALERDGAETYYDADDEEASDELERAARRLVDSRRERAADLWSTGVSHYEADRVKETIRCLEAAIDDAERAHELAERFRPEIADPLAERLAEMRNRARRVRETATVSPDVDTEAGDSDRERVAGESPESATGSDDSASSKSDRDGTREAPDAATVREIDTHHDITFRDAGRNEGGDATNGTDHGKTRRNAAESSSDDSDAGPLAPGDPTDAE